MVLMVPELNQFYDSFYYVDRMLQPKKFKDYNKANKIAYVRRHQELELNAKTMTAEFAQHTDGQISRGHEGDGDGVHRHVKVFRRFKKINRAYEIRKLADPALSAKEMAEKFDQEVQRRLLRA